LAAQFTPANLIGVYHAGIGRLIDTLSIRLDNAAVLNHIQTALPLRIGLQVSSSQSVTTRVYATNTLRSPGLTLRVSPDSSVAQKAVIPSSTTPVGNPTFAAYLRDFFVVVQGAVPAPPGMLVVGGIPGSRTYLRFNIPTRYLDSSIVVRATLLLNQVGSSALDGADTMRIQPFLGVAAPFVTDPAQAALITSYRIAPMDPLGTLPNQTTPVEIEVAPVFRVWAVQADSLLPRAIVLQPLIEPSPQQALFYSSEAADPTLRPRLRISYTLRTRIGTP
jgi:hypothetical protein